MPLCKCSPSVHLQTNLCKYATIKKGKGIRKHFMAQLTKSGQVMPPFQFLHEATTWQLRKQGERGGPQTGDVHWSQMLAEIFLNSLILCAQKVGKKSLSEASG